MKFKITLLLFSFAFLMSCNNKTPNLACQKFQKGEFKYSDRPFGEYLVTRKGDTQVEYNAKSNLRVEFGIKWKDDCTYELRFNKIVSNPGNLRLPEDLKDLIKTCKITAIENDTYTEEMSSNLTDKISTTFYEKVK